MVWITTTLFYILPSPIFLGPALAMLCIPLNHVISVATPTGFGTSVDESMDRNINNRPTLTLALTPFQLLLNATGSRNVFDKRQLATFWLWWIHGYSIP